MEFRVRQITDYLRNVGKTQLVGSEFKKRPQGRIKYLACNDFKATPRQILMGYRLRWAIEIFHKHIKMFLKTSCNRLLKRYDPVTPIFIVAEGESSFFHATLKLYRANR
jgi:hypothetical protein